jgi:hypothetical protein
MGHTVYTKATYMNLYLNTIALLLSEDTVSAVHFGTQNQSNLQPAQSPGWIEYTPVYLA